MINHLCFCTIGLRVFPDLEYKTFITFLPCTLIYRKMPFDRVSSESEQSDTTPERNSPLTPFDADNSVKHVVLGSIVVYLLRSQVLCKLVLDCKNHIP